MTEEKIIYLGIPEAYVKHIKETKKHLDDFVFKQCQQNAEAKHIMKEHDGYMKGKLEQVEAVKKAKIEVLEEVKTNLLCRDNTDDANTYINQQLNQLKEKG